MKQFFDVVPRAYLVIQGVKLLENEIVRFDYVVFPAGQTQIRQALIDHFFGFSGSESPRHHFDGNFTFRVDEKSEPHPTENEHFGACSLRKKIEGDNENLYRNYQIVKIAQQEMYYIQNAAYINKNQMNKTMIM